MTTDLGKTEQMEFKNSATSNVFRKDVHREWDKMEKRKQALLDAAIENKNGENKRSTPPVSDDEASDDRKKRGNDIPTFSEEHRYERENAREYSLDYDDRKTKASDNNESDCPTKWKKERYSFDNDEEEYSTSMRNDQHEETSGKHRYEEGIYADHRPARDDIHSCDAQEQPGSNYIDDHIDDEHELDDEPEHRIEGISGNVDEMIRTNSADYDSYHNNEDIAKMYEKDNSQTNYGYTDEGDYLKDNSHQHMDYNKNSTYEENGQNGIANFGNIEDDRFERENDYHHGNGYNAESAYEAEGFHGADYHQEEAQSDGDEYHHNHGENDDYYYQDEDHDEDYY